MIASHAFHRESNAALRHYILGALSSGTLTTLAVLQVPGFHGAYEQLPSPELFVHALIAVTFMYGFVLVTATRRTSFLQRLVARHEERVLHGFTLSCGWICGWALAVCLLHVTINDPSSAPLAAVLASYSVILTLFPVWAFANALAISKAYREFTIREKRSPLLIPIFGWALIALSVVFACRLILIA